MTNNHPAYRSKFQIVAGPRFIHFTQGVTCTKYRTFYDTKTILKFLGIYDTVHNKVQLALNNVPKLEPGFNTTASDDWDVSESAAVTLNRKEYNAAYKKAYNKAIYEELGVSIGKFKKLIKGKMFEAFIKPIPEDIRNKFIHGNGGAISERRLSAVHLNLPVIIQAAKDNQYNIIPFIMVFNTDPKGLREHLGKGLWKQLCANTLSRNKIIADYYLMHQRRPDDNMHSHVSLLRKIVGISSTLLSKQARYEVSVLEYLHLTCKGKWNNVKDCKPTADLYEDTLRMIHRYENEASILVMQPAKWSLRRLQEEHDRLVQIAMASRYSTKEFYWYKDFPLKDFCYKGYEVTLLKSEAEIGIEGQTMGHCVGMYGERSATANYLVFSVKKNGMRHSTIGMYLNWEVEQARRVVDVVSPNLFSNVAIEASFTTEVYNRTTSMTVGFNQQYMRYNTRLPDDDKANDIPDLIIQYTSENLRS